MMRKALEDFNKQLAFEPVIENRKAFHRKDRFLVLGMGGSQWPANLLWSWDESILLWQHRDYGLPTLSDSLLKEHLVLAVSYSGNTAETISGYEAALERKLPTLAIAIGGKLIEIAKEHKQPYIQLPNWDMQPRASVGLVIKALLTAMGNERGLKGVSELAGTFQPKSYEAEGKQLAAQCEGSVPIVYASRHNLPLAMAWKIAFNETGKIPAFFNAFPELNHNEMTGFDVRPSTAALSERFRWLLLTDTEDDVRIQKRMDVFEKLFTDRGHSITRVPIVGATRWERIFSSLLTAGWSALHTAEHYGVDATNVPMVEEFKKLIEG